MLSAEDKRIFGEGVLEILQDGFGFLKIIRYIMLDSWSLMMFMSLQLKIRKFNLISYMISGSVRPPRDNERYFALLKVSEINFEDPENVN